MGTANWARYTCHTLGFHFSRLFWIVTIISESNKINSDEVLIAKQNVMPNTSN